ncbi:uncharacterized protein BO97DRAFT_414197 [Aspergillus homomorphus CBS 101889]|uniref:C2H2-type domain-containing protein n=1 Tax=Aspergillus homomorphus (strain CBS 101889) TaxID=1450537 RepID=A0A395I1I1_ASPHC|nr:hypothetical protein BO97DRAFT_414197 [Aspergillus homomorphus CBS 101889]RAL12404.1 hypothetical protein BO97DRAFT_414197 [Aspergillus homomorphus CBS 101889]
MTCHRDLARYGQWLPTARMKQEVLVEPLVPEATREGTATCRMCDKLGGKRPMTKCSQCDHIHHESCVKRLIRIAARHGHRLAYGCPGCGKPWVTPSQLAQRERKAAEEKRCADLLERMLPAADREASRESLDLEPYRGPDARYPHVREGDRYICAFKLTRSRDCSKSYSRLTKLKAHQRMIHYSGISQCQECGGDFSNPSNLRNHCRRCHPPPPPFSPRCAEPQCGVECADRKALVQHLNLRHDLRVDGRACTWCGLRCWSWVEAIDHCGNDHWYRLEDGFLYR